VAQSSDEYENHVLPLKGRCLPKKRWEPHQNRPTNRHKRYSLTHPLHVTAVAALYVVTKQCNTGTGCIIYVMSHTGCHRKLLQSTGYKKCIICQKIISTWVKAICLV